VGLANEIISKALGPTFREKGNPYTALPCFHGSQGDAPLMYHSTRQLHGNLEISSVELPYSSTELAI